MQFFLLATGEENKLSPLTEQIASPMLPVLDRPVMTYTVELLARYGFKKILVSLWHSSDTLENYFGDGSRWNVNITYLLQRQALGTAGVIKRASSLLTSTFCVLPADTLLDLDIHSALAYHRAQGGIATLIVSKQQMGSTSKLQTIQLDANNQVIQPTAATSVVDYWVTGAYIFEPQVLEFIPCKCAYACANELISVLIASGQQIYGYVTDGYWNPLHSFRDFQAAQSAMLHSLTGATQVEGQPAIRYPYSDGKQVAPGVWCGLNTVIHPQAKLVPPLYIGSGCQIGAGAQIGPNVSLGAHTLVERDATIQHSTVFQDTYIGQLVDIQQRVVHQNLLIDQRTGVGVQVSEKLLLGATNPRFVQQIFRLLIDRVAALVLLLLFAPLLLVIGMMVWFNFGLPIFTVIQHIGVRPATRSGRAQLAPQAVGILRLRTYTFDGEHTAFGHWLEQWELHRLPELWNVIKGELALVGVKPLTPEETNRITEEWQQVRYQCPAGFTGLWYIQTNTRNNFDELCMSDTYQAVTSTWQQTIQMLLKTPKAWWRTVRRSAHSPKIVKSSEVHPPSVVQRLR